MAEKGITPILAINSNQASTRLHGQTGTQVLIARPETHQSGNSDGYSEDITFAIFVIEPMMTSGRTDDLEEVQSDRLLALASEILTRIETDTTTAPSLILGMSLSQITVDPETEIFGGWSGWSIEVSIDL